MKKKLGVTIGIVLAVIIFTFFVFTMLKGKSGNKNLSLGKFSDVSLLESQVDIDEAIKFYKNLSEDKKHEENMPEVLYNLGILYEKKSKFDEAKKYFGSKIAFYIDGGKIKSMPSTLIRLMDDGSWQILRQGSYKVSS